ncbi:alanine racemase [Magnetospirillum aberrantis]|uniref:Alanine racemase n=1 Tax=Magnetospirillum aberrantis SpK TaxID=908842 RepID=A0A7C9QTU0_9PROT|nr:alanine racemase [Magnetospirillum aberrantis]NFV80157.1 alanine racemase [Magnetospirillum aberrantis SpK]
MTAYDRAPAFLTIDVGAVVANWRLIRDRVGPGCEAAAVVKADCYGLGAERIVPGLAAAGCRTFFVATIDEGIAIRKVLPREVTVAILGGPLPGAAADLAEHALTPVLNSLDQIGLWAGYAAATGSRLKAALHLDTGMSRLGLDAPAVAMLAADPALLNGIDPILVMSHMACADETGHPKNRQQLTAFQTLSGQLGLPARRSLGASSTIFLGPDYHFDLVRPGAVLYGLNPTPDQANPMAAVVALHARILQVRDVDSPMTVGYGATHSVRGKGRVAVAALGYADGVFRSLGNSGFGVIEGERVPVVGRISMDLTTFDVSALAPEQARPGALIEIIGPHQAADDLAAQGGTIGYEVLTALGRRYLRTYQGEVV